jgi:hypothetical protein
MIRYVPVFEKDDGNRFFFPYEDYAASTEEEANRMGQGLAIVEGLVHKFKYTWQVLKIEKGEVPHIQARLGDTQVCIIEGPAFDNIET